MKRRGRIPVADVKMEHVTKDFRGVTAVRDFNLTVADQEFVVLVGPSGCGKTTTLRIVAGLEQQTSGSVYIGGKNVDDLSPKDRNIAMVFQNYALYPHMNVFDNMAFGLRLRHTPPDEIKRRVNEAADLLGIGTLLKRLPKELSGGQRQRVALGRAIVRRPSVFLMDEPLSNLDAKLRTQMRTELLKLHQRLQSTVIYVTHDQVEAMTMGSRIVVMKDGEIQQVAAPQDIYDRPANLFVAGFIGSPPMNFLTGRIRRENGQVHVVGDGFRVALTAEQAAACGAEDVVLGVRPEHVQPRASATDGRVAPAIDAVVDVAEPLGHEVYLHLSVGGNQLTARVEPSQIRRPGERVQVAFDPQRLHVFDQATGVAYF